MSIPADVAIRADVDIDGARMLRRLGEISRFGADPGPGLTRTGLSREEHAARRYLAEQCHRDGLLARTDQAGNLIVRRKGADPTRPAILLGSHIDTVVGGGALDGTYGVMAACEVLKSLADAAVELPAEPVAVAFTNEEGAGFAYPFFGSLGLIGQVNVAEAELMRDQEGRPLRDALKEIGGDLDDIGAAAWPVGSIACYFEVHIEQGPVLEARDVPIGVVDAITGRTIVDITVRGRQGHAGTTPMALRRDALPVAARAVLAVERLATHRGLCAVSTVGRVDAHPNVTNVIPGAVYLTAEIRDGRKERLLAAEHAIVTELGQLSAATEIDIEVIPRRLTHPVATNTIAQRAIADAADDLGLEHLTLFSGAGHDAQIVAEIAPIGMIFVPSRGGISHAWQEHTDDHHLVAGARTLLHSVLRLPTEELP
jgi:beta-ureidopropionase / N-carbamoyl-L-amino-acid hydrolase